MENIFEEQGNLYQGNRGRFFRGTGTPPPWEGLTAIADTQRCLITRPLPCLKQKIATDRFMYHGKVLSKCSL